MTYTSLKIVKILPYAWVYYPNGSNLGFSISKGYFSSDASTNIFQIVEDGKVKRPGVSLENISVVDETITGPTEYFSSFEELHNRLAILGCPLTANLSINTAVSTTSVSHIVTTYGNRARIFAIPQNSLPISVRADKSTLTYITDYDIQNISNIKYVVINIGYPLQTDALIEIDLIINQ